MAKSQEELDAESAYEDAVRNVKSNSSADRSAGPGYLRELREAVNGLKGHGGNVSTGEELLEGTGY